ncbi:MAG TPA: terminase family protein [Allosphingosinicella sp.]
MSDAPSIVRALLGADAEAAQRMIAGLSKQEKRWLFAAWRQWAHRGQREPAGDWRTWVLMAGRGFGKTRAGAEWVMGCVRGERPSAALGTSEDSSDPRTRAAPSPRSRRARVALPREGGGLSKVRIALVAASLDEARRVMVEGPSGIIAVARAGEVREYSFQRRRILFASGAEATLFSGAHPDGLRGPEHDFAWCDELAKWRYPKEAWDNLQLGLRRGRAPRALVTTTPRRGAALESLLGEDGVVRTGGGSATNPHLPDGWVEAQAARLTGILRRQELDGELIDEVKGALWPRALIEACRGSPSAAAAVPEAEELPYLKRDASARPRPPLHHPPTPAASADGPPPRPGEDLYVRVVIGVDPPASEMGDACGIVACGLGADGIGYVLADCSAGGLSPEGWARKVAAAAAARGASQVVAEANNGGDMIAAVLRGADPALRVKLVHARGGKVARATTVAALFEGGRAKFAGIFPALEEELAGLSYDLPYQGPGRSPDRADAMVWAMDALMPGAPAPGVRAL